MGAYEITTENGSLRGTNRANMRSFSLCRDQSYSLNLSKTDKFSGVKLQAGEGGTFQVQMERKTLVVEFLRPP